MKVKGTGFWSRFFRHRSTRVSLYYIAFLCFLALCGEFLSSSTPLYYQIEGKARFPIFKQWAYNVGLSDDKPVSHWKKEGADHLIYPPIPYSGTDIDMDNANYQSPFDVQDVKSKRFRHWLGTDGLGRDVAAGLVSGARVSMVVSVFATLLSAFLGMLIGGGAGFYGDRGFKVSRRSAYLGMGGGLLIILFFAQPAIRMALPMSGLTYGFTVCALLLIWLFAIMRYKGRINREGNFTLPLDFIVMRVIEIIRAIPGLFFILAVSAVIIHPSLGILILVIAFLRWPIVARYVRAEMLKVREMDYIRAARGFGFSESRVFFRHALPNALGPVMVVLAFGMASAVLLESTLSFLGIGVSPDQVSWGSLLSQLRSRFSAWWIAVFPGLALFLTVYACNRIGEAFQVALNPSLES